MAEPAVASMVVRVIGSLVGATVVAYVVLDLTCAGPPAPRRILSFACGVIAAAVSGFFALL